MEGWIRDTQYGLGMVMQQTEWLHIVQSLVYYYSTYVGSYIQTRYLEETLKYSYLQVL